MAYYDYAQKQNDLNRSFADETAASQYGRFVSQQRYSRDKQGMAQTFQRQAPRFNASFARRGLGDSGIFRRGLNERTSDYTNAYNDLLAQEGAQMGQYTMQDASRTDAYKMALQRLMEQLQAQRANENQFVGF